MNSALFRVIRVEPSITSLVRDKPDEIACIAQYARALHFMTPPSYCLSYNSFRRLLMARMDQSALHDGTHGVVAKDGSITKTAIPRAFEQHLEDDSMLADIEKGISSFRTAIMRAASRKPLEIVIARRPVSGSNCTRREPWDSKEPTLGCRFLSEWHRHESVEGMTLCGHAAAKAGDNLVDAVFTGIVQNNLSVRHLHMSHDSTGRQLSTSVPAWEQLDLGFLQSFTFTPINPLFGLSDRDNVRRRASDDVDNVLRQCHQNLGALHVGNTCWPNRAPDLDMPKLQMFSSLYNNTDTRSLAMWLKRWSGLKTLSLDRIYLVYPESEENWVHVLDAIRDHPAVAEPGAKGIDLQLVLDGPEGVTWTEVFGQLRYHAVVSQTMDMTRTYAIDKVEDYEWGLERHFTGAVTYEENLALRYWDGSYEPPWQEDVMDDDVALDYLNEVGGYRGFSPGLESDYDFEEGNPSEEY